MRATPGGLKSCGRSCLPELQELHAFEDVRDGDALVLADHVSGALALALLGEVRLIQIAQLEAGALAGSNVVAQRAMEAEELERAFLHVAGGRDEIVIVDPPGGVFAAR